LLITALGIVLIGTDVRHFTVEEVVVLVVQTLDCRK
jgi:hypothetical protein